MSKVITGEAASISSPNNPSNRDAGSGGTVGVTQTAEHRATSVNQPKVAILLCTYRGQRYLAEQLDSYAAQTHNNWAAWASDDHSEDNTHAILKTYQLNWSKRRLSIGFGPAKGYAANFLSLVRNTSIAADYYAYSDQDDIWEVAKLERAVQWLESIPQEIPALYCSRTRLVDAENNLVGSSPLFRKPPRFENALVQNIAGGNTMVFNNSARALLCETAENQSIVSHDWWTYLVVAGCGGKIFYDDKPTLRYRQHDSNLIGGNSSWRARLRRIRMLWQGRFRTWNDYNIAALLRLENKLTPENRLILKRFIKAREMGLVYRVINLKRCGAHRQTILGNLGLLAGVILRKI